MSDDDLRERAHALADGIFPGCERLDDGGWKHCRICDEAFAVLVKVRDEAVSDVEAQGLFPDERGKYIAEAAQLRQRVADLGGASFSGEALAALLAHIDALKAERDALAERLRVVETALASVAPHAAQLIASAPGGVLGGPREGEKILDLAPSLPKTPKTAESEGTK